MPYQRLSRWLLRSFQDVNWDQAYYPCCSEHASNVWYSEWFWQHHPVSFRERHDQCPLHDNLEKSECYQKCHVVVEALVQNLEAMQVSLMVMKATGEWNADIGISESQEGVIWTLALT